MAPRTLMMLAGSERMVLLFDRCLVIWVKAHQCVDRIMILSVKTSVRLTSVVYVYPNFLVSVPIFQISPFGY